MYKYIVLLISLLTFNGCQIQSKEKRDVNSVSEKFYEKLKNNDQHGAAKMFSRKSKRGADPLEQNLKRMYAAHGPILTHTIAGSVEKTSTSLGKASTHILIQRFNVVYSDGYSTQEELVYNLKDKGLKITKYTIKDKGAEWTSADSL